MTPPRKTDVQPVVSPPEIAEPTGRPQFGDASPEVAFYRVFFALLRIGRTRMPPVEKVLRDMGIADPIWYEILLAAEEAGPAGVQMLQLQKRLFVPQYALSRHIARIEKAGLIRREAGGGAGRAQLVFLTPAGEGLQERIWEVYRQEILTGFAGRLETDEAYDLLRKLNRLYP